MVKMLRKVWAGFWLACGVAFAATVLPVFLMSVGVVVGVPLALSSGGRSTYWQRAWIGFDKWCNVMLGGVITETISSRLGKSKVYKCAPVFGFRKIYLLVSWWLHQIDNSHVEKSIDWPAGCKCLENLSSNSCKRDT